MKKVPKLLILVAKIKYSLSPISLRATTSVSNEILLVIGASFITFLAAFSVYQVCTHPFSVCAVVNVTFTFTTFFTYMISVTHPSMCYCVMYYLGYVQKFIVQSQLEFCLNMNLLKHDEINQIEPVNEERNIENDISYGQIFQEPYVNLKYPSMLYSSTKPPNDNELLVISDSSVAERFQIMLRRGEKLLHLVEEAAPLYSDIFSQVSVIVAGIVVQEKLNIVTSKRHCSR